MFDKASNVLVCNQSTRQRLTFKSNKAYPMKNFFFFWEMRLSICENEPTQRYFNINPKVGNIGIRI